VQRKVTTRVLLILIHDEETRTKYISMIFSPGVVYTEAVLDFEHTPVYNLTIRATDIASRRVDTTLTIHVTDVNDNRPSFLVTSYQGRTSESSPVGNFVLDAHNDAAPLVMQARDIDSHENAMLVYAIVDGFARDVFEIDPLTGAIRTRVMLDHEVKAVYEFYVQVSDHGYPVLSSEVRQELLMMSLFLYNLHLDHILLITAYLPSRLRLLPSRLLHTSLLDYCILPSGLLHTSPLDTCILPYRLLHTSL